MKFKELESYIGKIVRISYHSRGKLCCVVTGTVTSVVKPNGIYLTDVEIADWESASSKITSVSSLMTYYVGKKHDSIQILTPA